MKPKEMLAYVVTSMAIVSMIFILSGSDMTGRAASLPPEEINAQIKVVTSPAKVIPPDSAVVVYLEGTSINATAIRRNASMGIGEFFRLSGRVPEIREGELPALGYYGMGYTGTGEYVINVSDFPIDRRLPPGNYTLRTAVSYKGSVIASMEKGIVV